MTLVHGALARLQGIGILGGILVLAKGKDANQGGAADIVEDHAATVGNLAIFQALLDGATSKGPPTINANFDAIDTLYCHQTRLFGGFHPELC